MKKTFFLFAALVLIAGSALADGKDVTIKGTVIDNMCASMHKDDMATFIKGHEKTCLLKESCAKSGYSIFSDGKLIKVDPTSQSVISEFLKKADSKTNVIAMGDQMGDSLRVESIKNQ